MKLCEAYEALLSEPALADVGPNPTRFKLKRLIELSKGEAVWMTVWTGPEKNFKVPAVMARTVADLRLSVKNFGDKRIHWRHVWRHYRFSVRGAFVQEDISLADQGVWREVWLWRSN